MPAWHDSMQRGSMQYIQKGVRANLTQTAQHGLDSCFTIQINMNVFDRRSRILLVYDFHFQVVWISAKKNLWSEKF